MANRADEINDDQIRVLGQHGKPDSISDSGRNRGRRLLITGILASAFAVALIVVLSVLSRGGSSGNAGTSELEQALYEPEIPAVVDTEPAARLGDSPDVAGKACTEHLTRTINDIPLDIYIPHNAVPELCLGVPDISDGNIVLAAQAADIRADNGKIVGAFVLKGEPLSWGLSKKGYCAIIDGRITVGVADNSPLFEEATEKEGFFFRQYPLVDNGRLVENELKGKAVRKAICDRAGEIMVVMTQTDESMHDFAQALVDLGVDNAVYLVGSRYSYGYFRDGSDVVTQFAEKPRVGKKYENYILWRF